MKSSSRSIVSVVFKIKIVDLSNHENKNFFNFQIMDQCEKLAQVEGFLAEQFVKRSDYPIHALTNLLSADSYKKLLISDKSFKKLHLDMEEIYKSSFSFGLRIEPDNYGGYGLFNRSGKVIKCGEIKFAVGLIAKKPKNREIDDWSLMEGDKLLVGVARWANHSCVANCDYYMSNGFRGRVCVRLRALREIMDGEQLVTFYNSDFFGENNALCLCEHEAKHGKEEGQGLEKQDDFCATTAKRKRVAKPRIKIIENDERSSLLANLIKFYDEDSNVSFESETSSLPLTNSTDSDWDLSDENFDTISNLSELSVASSTNFADFFGEDEDYEFGLDIIANFPISGDVHGTPEAYDETNELVSITGVTKRNLMASLLAIVSLHNAPDALLNDLLKRDQLIFGGQTVSPWAFKKQFEDFCSKYQSSKQSSENGELILLNFRPLLIDILNDSLPDILNYAVNKPEKQDISMPKFRIAENRISVRLIVNTDGATVSKTPVTSAWPLFFAVADLPPKKRQLFKNIVLGALFVGTGYPDFDVVFEHVRNQLSVTEKVHFNENDIAVSFEPILLIADLIAKSKVLKMKQCNGYYGCTLCTQRGCHIGRGHRYPHEEEFEMRSFNSHMLNIQELERGSIQELRARLGRDSDWEIKTQGVKGRSKVFNVISNLPLSSPVDPMHQLFLGVAKDILLYHYETMRSEHEEEINSFIGTLDLPKEFRNTIRKLQALHNFKAKEVKFLLLYLAPIIFPPYLFGENRKSDEVDLKKLVFSIRELFESSRNADFCDQLLCEFCVSMAEKTNKMDTINFHLLRHLGWQTKSIGPLYTASAAMFESANRLLIAPLTGTVNQCQLMVWRFIRAKMLIKMKFKEDCLTPMLADFLEKRKFDETYGFAENSDTRTFYFGSDGRN